MPVLCDDSHFQFKVIENLLQNVPERETLGSVHYRFNIMKLNIRGTLHCIVSARQTCRENKVSNKTHVLRRFHDIVGRAVYTALPTKAANIRLKSLNAFAMEHLEGWRFSRLFLQFKEA